MSDPSQLPPIASAPISVILLAQSQPSEAADALDRWRKFLGTLARPFEILLVQEASSDGPSANDPAVRIFTYEPSQGWRTALNEAIQSALHPLLLFCTADKQYQPSDMSAMLAAIDKVHLVVGYRTISQAPPVRVLLDIARTVLGRILLGSVPAPRRGWLGSGGWSRRWLARWIFGLRVADPECPFRLARRALFERMPIQSAGSFALIEMLAKANHLGALFAETPVAFTRPATPKGEAVSFSADARRVFRQPEFRTGQAV